MSSLNLEQAERALAAAKAKALSIGFKGSISVVDPRGDLLCMVRLDGGSWRTPAISRGKAVAASCFGVPSGELEDRSSRAVFRGLMAMEGGHMIPGQGALPMYRNGELVGAIGGSGGTSEEDEACARAGLEVLGLSTSR